MNRISIRKMRVFLAAVEEGSFTRASIRLNISQPAATIIINQIEEAVGGELFERQGNTRRAKLTELGTSAAETFARVVASYDIELGRMGELASGKRGARLLLVQFALADCLEPEWMSALLDRFAQEEVRIECRSRAEIMERLNNREATLAVVDGDVDEDRHDKLALASYNYVRASLTKSVEDHGTCNGVFVVAGFNERALKRARDAVAAVQQPEPSQDAGCVTEVGSLRLAAQVMQRTGQDAILPDIGTWRLGEYLGAPVVITPVGTLETGVMLLAQRGVLINMRLSSLRGLQPFRKLATRAE